ncbi:MAG: hypothetical protein V4819_04020 [Verrucomicrobiota bacterium]
MNFLNEIRWRPTIGDPSFMGWCTVFAYCLGAILATRAWFKTEDRIWLFVALGMAGLSVNKQLDLQSLFTDIGRVASYHGGWFEQRRIYQKWFVLGVIAGAGISGSWFIWRYNAFWVRHKLLTAGVFFLLTFIVVRAISFHHVDAFLKDEVGGVRMNWVLELGGIFLISLAAVRELLGKAK